MSVQNILDEVEQQIAEKLPAMLFERLVIVHKNATLGQGCICSYCRLKSAVTRIIADAGYHRRDAVKQRCTKMLQDELTRII